MSRTFYWHDYETSGADPRLDRPVQFAGQRTDEDMNMIGEPDMFYCRLAPDQVMRPQAALITGITPDVCAAKGLLETQFAERVRSVLSVPGTCGVGYNSMRFDDEVTRNMFYRNFIPPYDREWRDGNSRWDLIDAARAFHALHPQDMTWPTGPDGVPSFRLESLAAANGLSQERAHDALSDVYSCIDLARLLKRIDPALFSSLLAWRDKRAVSAALDPVAGRPMLHVCSYYPAARGCISAVLPLLVHPGQPNAVVVADLSADVEQLLEMTPAQVEQRLFVDKEAARLPLASIAINKSPVLLPANALSDQNSSRLGVDLQAWRRRYRVLHERRTELAAVLRAAYVAAPSRPPPQDPELALYAGFASPHDVRLAQEVRLCDPQSLAHRAFDFQDPRWQELLFRFRARNFPESLALEESQRWAQFCRERLTTDTPLTTLTLQAMAADLEQLSAARADDPHAAPVLSALSSWLSAARAKWEAWPGSPGQARPSGLPQARC